MKKHPNELWKEKKPNINYFNPFRFKCFIHNNDNNNLSKFDTRSNKGIFNRYSPSSHAFRVFNKIILCVEESVHVVCDDSNSKMQNIGNDIPEKDSHVKSNYSSIEIISIDA